MVPVIGSIIFIVVFFVFVYFSLKPQKEDKQKEVISKSTEGSEKAKEEKLEYQIQNPSNVPNFTNTYTTKQEEEYSYEKRVQEENEHSYINNQLYKSEYEIQNKVAACDFDGAVDILSEALAIAYEEKYTVDVHFFLIHVAETFYSMRDVDPISLNYCLSVCARDMKILRTFVRLTCHDGFYAVTPTSAAIILEKQGDFESAIKVCDFAIELNLWDSNVKTFLPRKARLEKKLQKSNSL